MCGIAGLIRLDASAAPVTPRELRQLGDRMPWRGPDDEGFLHEGLDGVRRLFGGSATSDETFDARLPYSPSREMPAGDLPGGFGFAFRRLSILDLSPAGHQPMCDPTRRYWIVFNGEIYNYIELRAELAARGARFATGSDTEVLLAAWAEWGEAMLPRLNGMWGLALGDPQERRLFSARDRFGVKPSHYRIAAGRLAFAS